jgi:hypothetical protein
LAAVSESVFVGVIVGVFVCDYVDEGVFVVVSGSDR